MRKVSRSYWPPRMALLVVTDAKAIGQFNAVLSRVFGGTPDRVVDLFLDESVDFEWR